MPIFLSLSGKERENEMGRGSDKAPYLDRDIAKTAGRGIPSWDAINAKCSKYF